MNPINETKKPEKRFSVIYVDAPWEADDWCETDTSLLPIRNLAAADSILMLWAPNALLDDALAIMQRWDFFYAGLIAWRKPKVEIDTAFLCDVCEYMLIGRQGSVKTDHLFRNMLYDGPATRGGYKPQAFRQLFKAAGYYAFGQSGTYLDVFGQYWKQRFPEYEQGNWEVLHELDE
jgi:N6-adenosine-specific RNA methylase IME4